MAWFQSSMLSWTIMVIWHQWMVLVTSVCYKTLFDRSCGTLRHVRFSNPFHQFNSRIYQWEVSRPSPQLKGSETAHSAHCTVQTSTSLTSIFERLRKIRIFKEILTRSTHWCNVWKVSLKGYSQETISRVSKNVLKHATLCLEAGGDHFQHIL